MEDLSHLRSKFDQLTGRRDQLKQQMVNVQDSIKGLQRQARIAEKAIHVVRVVALETQSQLEYQLSDTITAAEVAVFGADAYELAVEFKERRGKTECDLLFRRGDQLLDPISSTGYGTVDVAAFALRIACWSMGRQHAPVLILDEPFKHMKGSETNRRAIQMVKEVATELKLQVIMVSDERAPIEDIQEGADRVFRITKEGSISKVECDG